VQGRTWSDAPLDVFVAKSADAVTCSRRAKRAGEHVVAGRSPFPLPRVSPRRFGTVLRLVGRVGTFVPQIVTPGRRRSDHDDRLARRHPLRRLAQRSRGGPSVYAMVLTEHRVVEGGSRHAVRGGTGLRLHDRPVPAGFRHDDASSDAGWDLVPGRGDGHIERVSGRTREQPEPNGWFRAGDT